MPVKKLQELQLKALEILQEHHGELHAMNARIAKKVLGLDLFFKGEIAYRRWEDENYEIHEAPIPRFWEDANVGAVVDALGYQLRLVTGWISIVCLPSRAENPWTAGVFVSGKVLSASGPTMGIAFCRAVDKHLRSQELVNESSEIS
jgi:hypothetical protein